MRTPTDEQERILKNEENARIRLVKSAPGSGKTWLIAEEMRRKLAVWKDTQSGIAALSFTNVASDAITEALGYTPSHPHFVGTLDTFVYRYIARPFAKLFDSTMPVPELLPAEVADHLGESQRWTKSSLNIQIGQHNWQTDNIYRISFTGKKNGSPIFRAKTNPWTNTTEELDAVKSKFVFEQKKLVWRSGRISHSDAAFIASEVLRSNGDFVRGLLLRRFPIIVVDELQDTGWYLGQVLQELLKDPRCNALLVGDPDQAIFEFNGAKPKLFYDFEHIADVKTHDLNKSLRCPLKVCAVAKMLTSTRRALDSANGRTGRTTLAVCNSMEELRELSSEIRQRFPHFEQAILSRWNKTVNEIRGQSTRNLPPFGSPPIEKLHDAVMALRRGDMKQAFAGAQAALARTVFDTEAPESACFGAEKLQRSEWKQAVVRLILKSNEEIHGETLYAWGVRMRDEIKSMLGGKPFQRLELLGTMPKAPRLPKKIVPKKKPKQRLDGILRKHALEDGTSNPPHEQLIDVATIHAVKGRTLNTSILFTPASQKPDACISNIWWSDDPAKEEERRVAYVAVTRAEEWFILCVDADCASRLRNAQPAFHMLFEEKNVKQLLAELAGNNGAA